MTIHPQKVLTSLQETPGFSISLCLNGVLGKKNSGSDMSYFFKELLCFFLSFNLLETHKHFAAALSHMDGMQSAETATLFLHNWASVNLSSKPLTKLERFCKRKDES